MTVYRLFWDEFSSWYLEMVKPAYGQPIDAKTYQATVDYFDALLRMLHPFMPFITEELWQHISERRDGESIMYAPMPEAGIIDNDIVSSIEVAKEVITGVRAVRAQKNIPPKETLQLRVIGILDNIAGPIVAKLGNLSEIAVNAQKDAAAASFMVGTTEFNIPLAIDVAAEIARLEKEIAYLEGFKASVEKKLSNERFVNGAPEAVVNNERNKLADATSKIAALRASLDAIK